MYDEVIEQAAVLRINEFRQKLRVYKNRERISFRTMAEESGVSPTALGNFINGNRETSAITLMKLSVLIGEPV